MIDWERFLRFVVGAAIVVLIAIVVVLVIVLWFHVMLMVVVAVIISEFIVFMAVFTHEIVFRNFTIFTTASPLFHEQCDVVPVVNVQLI